MTRNCNIATCIFLFVACWTFPSRLMADSDDLRAYFKSWTLQETRVKTAKFTLQRTRISHNIDASQQPIVGNQFDVSFSEHCWRYTRIGGAWNVESEELNRTQAHFQTTTTAVWNGNVRKHFFSTGKDSKAGSIDNDELAIAEERDLRPICLLYRPTRWGGMTFDDPKNGKLEIISENEVIDGTRVEIIRQTSDGPHGIPNYIEQLFWISNENGQFRILRFSLSSMGTPFSTTEIQYRPNVDIAIPTQWTTVVYSDDTPPVVSETVEVVVEQGEVNIRLESDSFEFSFPKNTWVVDETQKREYMVKESGIREITRRDIAMGRDYQYFAESNNDDIDRTTAFLWIALAILSIIAVVFGVRLLRQRH